MHTDEDLSARQPESSNVLRLASSGTPATAAQPTAPSDVGADGHLLDYVRILYKRRWTAGTAFLVVLATVTTYTFTVTPVYEARTRLLIEAEGPNVINFTEVVDEQRTKADYYQTQYNILQSRHLARKTIDALHLWDSPHLGGKPRAGIASLFGMKPAEPKIASSADETADQSRAIDRFLDNLTVSPIRNSRLVDLKYQLSDPDLAMRIVNAIAKNYIQQNLEYKFMASKEASDWLGDRLTEQRRQVEAAEGALQRYREQNEAISMQDRENIVVQKLADLNAAVTQAKTDRFQKQALYNQLQSLGGKNGGLDTFPAILSNTYIQQQKAELAQLQSQQSQLSEKLGDKHPEIIKIRTAIQLAQAKLDGEIAKVVQSVRNEYLAAVAKENSLTRALDQQKGEALAMNRKAIDYGVLDRDVQSSKQIYESLLQRAKETGVSRELKTSNIRVVDAAEQPRVPASPQKLLNFTLAFSGGGILAIGLAFFFEYVDSRIKTPDEIRTYLGLTPLGMVPAIEAGSWQGNGPLISYGVPPGFAEAIRAIRTNVLFSSAEEGARTLVVTSTAPGEGKTLIAANLAVGLAQAGQRVLLIDADMRCPRLHELFKQNQEPGLSNLMVGHATPSTCIRKSSALGLWLLTSGRVPPNPAELLGSQRFKEFIRSLGDHFDSVIIDSPPTLAVTDAAVAASAASGVVFVIGAEMTTRKAARVAIQQLENARVRLVGAVLNRVELERNAYYYSGYYKREYVQYYHAVR
ncbi:MAG TPA: polysaccharide biosynthesis tyrosine autokinase [Vicinamibacterales bacterium]